MATVGFASQPIFESGPYRFALEPEGTLVVPWLAFGTALPGSRLIGALEQGVVVRGRLVAPDENMLDALLGDIRALLTSPPTVDALVDPHGRAYVDMSFVKFTTGDRVDRGRSVSIPYTARFLRVAP